MVKSQETYAVELEAPRDVLKKLREEVFVNINLMGDGVTAKAPI